MDKSFESVDWSEELQTLVSQAKSREDRKAAFAFAQALSPYLEKPELLKTLLGKIMQSPIESVAIVASEGVFKSLEEVREKVGRTVTVVPL